MITETEMPRERLRPRILETEETGRLELSPPLAPATDLPALRTRRSRSPIRVAATGFGILVVGLIGIDLVQFIDGAFAHGAHEVLLLLNGWFTRKQHPGPLRHGGQRAQYPYRRKRLAALRSVTCGGRKMACEIPHRPEMAKRLRYPPDIYARYGGVQGSARVPAALTDEALFREPVCPALLHRALEGRARMHARQPCGEVRIGSEPVEHLRELPNVL